VSEKNGESMESKGKFGAYNLGGFPMTQKTEAQIEDAPGVARSEATKQSPPLL
jgi:hypothetical protein